MIARADRLLTETGPDDVAGMYVLEALIQATHCARARTGSTDWAAIVHYYDVLIDVAPSIGARVAAAAASLEANGPESALSRLDAIEHPQLGEYQPWWSVRGHALLALGDRPAADEALRQAAGLTSDPAVREWLLGLITESH
jgi:RNA polymerase sigma-70 factor (ECF subfamily)